MQCNVLSPASPFIQDAENVNAATWEDHSASTVHYRDSGSQIVSDKYNFMQTSKCFSDSCGTPDLVGTAWLKQLLKIPTKISICYNNKKNLAREALNFCAYFRLNLDPGARLTYGSQ